MEVARKVKRKANWMPTTGHSMEYLRYHHRWEVGGR